MGSKDWMMGSNTTSGVIDSIAGLVTSRSSKATMRTYYLHDSQGHGILRDSGEKLLWRIVASDATRTYMIRNSLQRMRAKQRHYQSAVFRITRSIGMAPSQSRIKAYRFHRFELPTPITKSIVALS
jgi:hypothetical protein